MARHVPNSQRQSRLFGYLVLLSGGILAAAGSLAVGVAPYITSWWGMVAIVSGAAALWASGYLLIIGRRHVVRSAGEMLAADARPPVLYLRSFDMEERLAAGEAALAELFSEVGPVIAIGRPSDGLPPLGAFRHYVEHEGAAWQAYIDDVLPKAGLVLLSLGRTAGLAWEIERCRQVLSPVRFAVLVSEPLDVQSVSGGAVVAGLPGVVALSAGRSDVGTPAAVGPWHGAILFDRNWSANYRPFMRPMGSDYVGYAKTDVRGGLADSDIARHTLHAALADVPDVRPQALEKRRRYVHRFDHLQSVGVFDGALLWFLVNGIRLGFATSNLATRLALLMAGLCIVAAVVTLAYLLSSSECKIDCVVLTK